MLAGGGGGGEGGETGARRQHCRCLIPPEAGKRNVKGFVQVFLNAQTVTLHCIDEMDKCYDKDDQGKKYTLSEFDT